MKTWVKFALIAVCILSFSSSKSKPITGYDEYGFTRFIGEYEIENNTIKIYWLTKVLTITLTETTRWKQLKKILLAGLIAIIRLWYTLVTHSNFYEFASLTTFGKENIVNNASFRRPNIH